MHRSYAEACKNKSECLHGGLDGSKEKSEGVFFDIVKTHFVATRKHMLVAWHICDWIWFGLYFIEDNTQQ
jgi:hypothetical protein